MCYRCQVCDRVHHDKGPALVIRQFREVQDRTAKDGVRKEIAKELLACGYCHEGHSKGIPLTNLAKAVRPEPAPTRQQIREMRHTPLLIDRLMGVPVPNITDGSAVCHATNHASALPPQKKRKSTDALIQAVETEGRNPRKNVRKHPKAAKRRQQQDRPG